MPPSYKHALLRDLGVLGDKGIVTINLQSLTDEQMPVVAYLRDDIQRVLRRDLTKFHDRRAKLQDLESKLEKRIKKGEEENAPEKELKIAYNAMITVQKNLINNKQEIQEKREENAGFDKRITDYEARREGDSGRLKELDSDDTAEDTE